MIQVWSLIYMVVKGKALQINQHEINQKLM